MTAKQTRCIDDDASNFHKGTDLLMFVSGNGHWFLAGYFTFGQRFGERLTDVEIYSSSSCPRFSARVLVHPIRPRNSPLPPAF